MYFKLCCRLTWDLRAFLVRQNFWQYWHKYPEDSICLDSQCSNRDVLNFVWWLQSAHRHITPDSVTSFNIFASTAAAGKGFKIISFGLVGEESSFWQNCVDERRDIWVHFWRDKIYSSRDKSSLGRLCVCFQRVGKGQLCVWCCKGMQDSAIEPPLPPPPATSVLQPHLALAQILYSEQIKLRSTWLWLGNSLVCDGDWNGHCMHFCWDTLCDRGGMATLQSAHVWLPRGFPCSAGTGWNVHMRYTGSQLLLLRPPCSIATAQPW